MAGSVVAQTLHIRTLYPLLTEIGISNGFVTRLAKLDECSVDTNLRNNPMKVPNIFEDDTPPLNFAAGDTIFAKGDEGNSMFSVKSGEVEIVVDGTIVEVVGTDGFFGEMAIIEGGTRSATARAKTACVLIPITARRFEFMVHETPFFAMHVMKGLSRRLRGKC